MNYKKIMLIIGIMLCLGGTVLYFVDKDIDEEPVIDEPPVVKVECSSELVKEFAYVSSLVDAKVKFLSCVEEVKNASSGIKEYKDVDSKYSISFSIIDKSAKEYNEELFTYYTKEMEGAHATLRKEPLTSYGDTFYVIDSKRIANEAGRVSAEYYNISYPIGENKTLYIKLISHEKAFDEDFALQIDESVLVTIK